jgi:hypothetical protein
MPRFFFHVRDSRTEAPDEEGAEFADAEAACAQATIAAAEMLKDLAPADYADVSIAIRDESGIPVCEVVAVLTIQKGRAPSRLN